MIEFKKFNSKTTAGSIPDLTPLIDMVFLLLIFFLLTSSLSRPAVTVELPDAENTVSVDEQMPAVIIRADGSLFINESLVTESELSLILKDFVYAGGTEVLIQSDRGVPFERIIEIMDISRNSGIYSISFMVRKYEE
jgi:biopolymer transport protein ExbD